MRASEEDDEQFYRDTERIAFPAPSDEQLATLDSLGKRRKVGRGEIIYKAGQRDVPFNLVLSGELEVLYFSSANMCVQQSRPFQFRSVTDFLEHAPVGCR